MYRITRATDLVGFQAWREAGLPVESLDGA
jgi:hypothetical protein